ncbi:MAG TPA: choice-of-anchor Q domain-containing protein [Rhodanobacteraceae bacterium]|nr:choice-of-anchor Q domain-containing protein [Rhodanobacteraceae bacterium]
MLAAISSQHASAQAGGYIVATDAGSPTSSTCTLAQAIGLANAVNGVSASALGSATTDFGTCFPAPLSQSGPYILVVIPPQITLTTIDNYWYGPNALPPIASNITIVPQSGILQLTASHTGDPTPATANAFRFFYVSGGLEFHAGSLTLDGTVLQGGYAKGGDSGAGGGGAGMGGAIFNQGYLGLSNVFLIGNAAQGGNVTCSSNCPSSALGGGGMGQDGQQLVGGGFGWAAAPGTYGGFGGYSYGGGGGGFIAGSDGGAGPNEGNAGPGGGDGKLGGNGGTCGPSGNGGLAGDGGGGGGSQARDGGVGGNFGAGGGGGNNSDGGAGGGGVGSGGGGASLMGGSGGGGGFGGGGGVGFGCQGGNGGFGGGGAYGLFIGGVGGFGGGRQDTHNGTGGAGMGGAIFNHTGTVSLINVTATGNASRGGAGSGACAAPCGGSGLGAVLFNLNGNVTIDFSTLAGNTLSGNNLQADGNGPEDGTVYSLAYGNLIQGGSASSATLKIHDSIIRGTHADGGLQSDASVNVVNGANTNSSSLVYVGKNFIGQSYTVIGVSQSGTSPSTVDPLLGALSIYRASSLMPVLPIGPNSPAKDSASSCYEADGSTTLTNDARGAARPYGSQCDVGAYEFDGDYIFAANNEPTL